MCKSHQYDYDQREAKFKKDSLTVVKISPKVTLNHGLCEACSINNDSLETSGNNCYETPCKHLTATIRDINSKLLNYGNVEELDLKTSLTLAAEVGITLLAENTS